MGIFTSMALPVINAAIGALGDTRKDAMSLKSQKEMQNISHEQAIELAEMQNQWELDRMAVQYGYNQSAADYSQQLAKDMWEYTGIGGQVRQMKENNINPALMYGRGGGGGQSTNGGSMQGVTALQPMGLSVAIQAKQQEAQSRLAEAQARRLDAETAQMKTVGIAQSIAGIVQTIAQTSLTVSQKTKVKTEVEQIGKTVEQLDANIESIKENTKLIKFQNLINELKQKATIKKYVGEGDEEIETGELTFEDMIIGSFTKEWLIRQKILSRDEVQALLDKDVAYRLYNDLDLIVQGKLNELSISEKTLEKLQNDIDRQDWELKNDKALGDIINEIGGDSKYSKLLMLVINRLLQK